MFPTKLCVSRSVHLIFSLFHREIKRTPHLSHATLLLILFFFSLIFVLISRFLAKFSVAFTSVCLIHSASLTRSIIFYLVITSSRLSSVSHVPLIRSFIASVYVINNRVWLRHRVGLNYCEWKIRWSISHSLVLSFSYIFSLSLSLFLYLIIIYYIGRAPHQGRATVYEVIAFEYPGFLGSIQLEQYPVNISRTRDREGWRGM